MSTELEGAALFDAACRAMGARRSAAWGHSQRWMLVPRMMKWLVSDGGHVNIYTMPGCVNVSRHRSGCTTSEERDLPTALARLVLRVAELEGKS